MTLRKIVGEVKNPTSGGIWSKEKETRCNKGLRERAFLTQMPPSLLLCKLLSGLCGEGRAAGGVGRPFSPFRPVGRALCFLSPVHRAGQAASLSSFLSQLPALGSFSLSNYGPAEKVQVF